jgi:hypothetical protein
MIPKTTLAAALVLFAFLGAAEAQQGGIVGGGVRVSGVSAVPSGWHVFHIAHCSTSTDGFFIFPLEDIGIQYLFTQFPFAFFTITSACQTGNLVGVFIVDPSTLAWNNFYTFTFK